MRKGIVDVAWSQFMQMTGANAEEAGWRVMGVDLRNTFKLYSSCGNVVQKRLSDRIHACPYSGLVLGRDHTAALNILYRGLHIPRVSQNECRAAHAEAQVL